MELNVWKIIKITLVLGVLFVMACCSQVIVWKDVTFAQNFYSYLYTCGTLLLVAGGCYFAGGLSGFLFGIPKIFQPSTNLGENEKFKRAISQNDNLVQISDWVTKIIVGVGLTQLYKIPSFLMKIGTTLAPSFGTDEGRGRNVAIATVLYFTIIGFMSVYLWTRLFFTKMVSELERDLGDEVKIFKKILNEVQESSIEGGGGKTLTKEDIAKIKDEQKAFNSSGEHNDDPQKGKWGGISENNGRKIIARVTPSEIHGYYVVVIDVISTDKNKPLEGYVRFHLHDTFKNPNPIIAVYDNKATLRLKKVYGAFTVGAEADDGGTKLELDLAELENAPKQFREK